MSRLLACPWAGPGLLYLGIVALVLWSLSVGAAPIPLAVWVRR